MHAAGPIRRCLGNQEEKTMRVRSRARKAPFVLAAALAAAVATGLLL
jgi:hypothetical protein